MGEGCDGLLKLLTLCDVCFEARAEVGPGASALLQFLTAVVKQGLQDEESWDAHEDGGISALDEFVEWSHLIARLLEQPAEHVELLESFRTSDLVLPEGPGVLECRHHLHQGGIVLELGVQKFNILRILLHQLPVAIVGTLDVLSYL